MAGTTKSYAPTEIIQGPGICGRFHSGAPARWCGDAGQRRDSGRDDASGIGAPGRDPTAVTTTVKPKISSIQTDQLEAPIDSYLAELDAKIDAEMAQMESQKLAAHAGRGRV